MNRCPITYADSGDQKYSDAGLRKLSPKLKILNDFPYSAEEQVKESVARASKMSIQGVHPKLSVRLNIKHSTFEIVDEDDQSRDKRIWQNRTKCSSSSIATFSI